MNHAKKFNSFVHRELIRGLAEDFGVQLLSPPLTFEIVPTLMGACDPSPNCVVSVYFLNFNKSLIGTERKKNLLFKLDQLRQHLRQRNEFEGMTTGWSISEPSQSGSENEVESLMIVLGWATFDDASYLEPHAKIDAETSGTKVMSVYDKWFQPVLDAAQLGWTKYDISLHLFLEGLHR